VSDELADLAAEALVDAWRALMAVHPDAWMETRPGLVACVTGIPLAGLNGIWCSERDASPADIADLLREVERRGVPHVLQLRPGTDASVLAIAEKRGLIRDEDVPLMRLDDPAALQSAHAAALGLTIRQLGPEDGDLHAHMVGAGFGEEPEHFVRLLPPSVMAADGVRAYVGEVDGQVVTTAFGMTRGDYVAIFNVATPPKHRRRGYGAAVTARAVEDGLSAGASWAWLQSSPAGHRIYEALGFRTLERWRCWVRV
jgi:ribosomal protein S18 acetylase RimI-like enzyme